MLTLWWILLDSLTLEGVQGEYPFEKFGTTKASTSKQLVVETLLSNSIHFIPQTVTHGIPLLVSSRLL